MRRRIFTSGKGPEDDIDGGKFIKRVIDRECRRIYTEDINTGKKKNALKLCRGVIYSVVEGKISNMMY